MKAKSELRKLLKNLLSSMTMEEVIDKSNALSRHLDHLLTMLLVIQQKSILGAYAPIQKEPLWYLFFEDAYSDYLAFPSFENDEMLYRQAKLQELESREDFGVKIKSPPSWAKPTKPDVLLVPGLAFSKKGKRLGRGKGFYDKYLENHKTIKIGLCFEVQLEENLRREIPSEVFDIEMDYIVTELGIYKKS